VGCGRGAVLILAAHRLPGGQAWGPIFGGGGIRAAIAGMPPCATRCRRVRDRVDLTDADARDLPFPAASFDVVVSNLTIHNIKEDAGRKQALHEAVRVLRPGGSPRRSICGGTA